VALRVLLVDDDVSRAQRAMRALRDAGHAVVSSLTLAADLLAAVRECRADLVMIVHDAADRQLIEAVGALNRVEPRPVVLFTDNTDQSRIQDGVAAGVSAYVVGGFTPERVRAVVEVARVRFEETRSLRAELDRARASLAERKLIERAKGLVMKHRNVNEDEAYSMLRKMAMDRNQRLAETAENVIAMSKLLG
jgi:response regulator NasT